MDLIDRVTKGTWHIDRNGNVASSQSSALFNVIPLKGVALAESDEAHANSRLLLDAGKTVRRTGKTPGQLADENDKLRKACTKALAVLSGDAENMTKAALIRAIEMCGDALGVPVVGEETPPT